MRNFTRPVLFVREHGVIGSGAEPKKIAPPERRQIRGQYT